MGDKIKKGKPVWLKGNCPICGELYNYLSDYKPATCSKFSCIQKNYQRSK